MATLRRTIIAIGASAGGVEALIKVVRGLPSDLPASLFVVLHMPPFGPGHLSEILTRRGPLPAMEAENGQAIEPGHIYVAVPDRHLLVRNGYVELSRGPHENHSRPAVDPLFRSVARAYGPRAIGVVLSGALGDGAMGLLAIKGRGGATVVQDPADALIESMPRAALELGRVNFVLPVAEMPALLDRLVREPLHEGLVRDTMEDTEERGSMLARRDIAAQARGERANDVTVYTCPECGGTMWQIDQNGLMQFNCHVGHTYGAEILLGEMSEELEAALWRCVRLLTEKATLTRQFSERLYTAGQEGRAERIADQARLDDRHGQLIRDLLLEGTSNPASEAMAVEQMLEEADMAHLPARAE
jgi:two-component system chemotaxis response regulator CheB